MRTSGGAAIGVVTELMDMHASFGVGIMARDVPCDLGGSMLGLLLKSHCASDI